MKMKENEALAFLNGFMKRGYVDTGMCLVLKVYMDADFWSDKPRLVHNVLLKWGTPNALFNLGSGADKPRKSWYLEHLQLSKNYDGAPFVLLGTKSTFSSFAEMRRLFLRNLEMSKVLNIVEIHVVNINSLNSYAPIQSYFRASLNGETGKLDII